MHKGSIEVDIFVFCSCNNSRQVLLTAGGGLPSCALSGTGPPFLRLYSSLKLLKGKESKATRPVLVP